MGGQLGRTGGFYADRDLARRAGQKGGRLSRRGPAKV
jgi:general stress protein YciG